MAQIYIYINRILKGGVVIPLIFLKVPQSSLYNLRVSQEHPPKPLDTTPGTLKNPMTYIDPKSWIPWLENDCLGQFCCEWWEWLLYLPLYIEFASFPGSLKNSWRVLVFKQMEILCTSMELDATHWKSMAIPKEKREKDNMSKRRHWQKTVSSSLWSRMRMRMVRIPAEQLGLRVGLRTAEMPSKPAWRNNVIELHCRATDQNGMALQRSIAKYFSWWTWSQLMLANAQRNIPGCWFSWFFKTRRTSIQAVAGGHVNCQRGQIWLRDPGDKYQKQQLSFGDHGLEAGVRQVARPIRFLAQWGWISALEG